MAILSRIQPIYYHCCPESCVAYIGRLADKTQCPICKRDRYTPKGNARRFFCYIPLIPRLQRLFANPITSKLLRYRHNYRSAAGVSDVFDGKHYKELRIRIVTVDGQPLDHQYFSHKNDIAFSLCLDSYLLYKRRRNGPSATPILIQIYNWPPELRTHLKYLLCLGVIPGPRTPKDLDSFLVPFEEECVCLAQGVEAFDQLEKERFDLHAYHLFPHGDILAIEKLLKLKGHNAITPCRSCKIKAINNPLDKKTYYVPLMRPRKTATWDARNLPLRQHMDWQEADDDIAVFSATKKNQEELAKYHGIKGLPSISRVGSIDYARGVPWDFMHLLLENVVQNLVLLWMGRFKDLGNKDDYVISERIWKEIGEETAAARKTIPSAFVRSLGNIVEDRGYFTAEGWGFWFMYLMPTLLQGRLKGVYFYHALQLASIMKRCIQFTLTHNEIDELEEDIITWVKEFEALYYRYEAERLCVCTLTIHGLLHICDNIRFCGPVWTTWTFWMERYCGILQAGLRSRVHPWANLNNRVLQRAYLASIDLYYGLDDDFMDISKPLISERETRIADYDHTVLRLPRNTSFKPDQKLRKIIAGYFAAVFQSGRDKAIFEAQLPVIMPSWGRVRVGQGGDSIRSSSASQNPDNEREMSYVRYELQVTRSQSEFDQRVIFYGELERVLECRLNDNDLWRDWKEKRLLLAVIKPCKTNGQDATLNAATTYSQHTTRIVTDIRTVQCVIGRVWSRKKSGIIDRSGSMARTQFISNLEGIRSTEKPSAEDTDDSDMEYAF